MPAPFAPRSQVDPGTDLGEWTEDGDIRLPGGLILGARRTRLDAPGGWSAFTYTGTAASAGATYPTAGSCVEPGGRVFLRGRVSWTGNIAGGTTLFTIAEGHRPARDITYSVRTGAPSNVATQMVITRLTGAVSLITATGNDGFVGLDGLSYRVDDE